jgi:hypothetical protein
LGKVLSSIKNWLNFWPLVLPILWLIPGLGSFPYPSASSPYSDLTISHYPNAIFLIGTILEHHTIPLWSPLILSGYAFAADPLSGLWYPPGWLALILPLPLGFNVMVVLHLIWGGLGTYLLLKSEGLSSRSALFGGLAFEAFSKYFAHYGAGHLTLLYAVPWTPWLIFAQRKQTMEWIPKSDEKKWLRFISPGVILALIFLADPRWAVYAGILWWSYNLTHKPHWQGMVKETVVAGLLSTPLALPLLEYTRLSTRAELNPQDVFAFSLSPVRLLGLVFPDLGGYHEWVLYPGGIVLILTILAFLWPNQKSEKRFWIGVGLVALLFSFGSNVPGMRFLANLPGLGLLRVPTRILFALGLSLAVLAAMSVDYLMSNDPANIRRRANILFVALFGFVVALSGGIWFLSRILPVNFAWGTLVIIVGAVWIALMINQWVPKPIWWIGLICIGFLDWTYVNLSLFEPRAVDLVLTEQKSVTEYIIAKSNDLYRTYSPSYSLPQQIAAIDGMQLADGVDPLQLKTYAEFMEKATGVPSTGYSVTIPPFNNSDPKTSNLSYHPDPGLLGLLNVGYIAAEFDIPDEDLELVKQFGSTRIYKNINAMPRAWVQSSNEFTQSTVQSSEVMKYTPNRIEVRADGPGLLVISEIKYPGWQVYVDDKPAEIQSVQELLRGVSLEEGNHKVKFIFRPASVYLGLVGWSLGDILLIRKSRYRS